MEKKVKETEYDFENTEYGTLDLDVEMIYKVDEGEDNNKPSEDDKK